MKNVDNDACENNNFEVVRGNFIMCVKSINNKPIVCAIKISEIKKIEVLDEDSCLIYLYKDDFYLCPCPFGGLLEQFQDKNITEFSKYK